jgi:hypothetical protein
MAFEPFATPFQVLAAAPFSPLLEATSFSFHHFAPSDLVASDLFLSL